MKTIDYNNTTDTTDKGLSLWQVIVSILASFIGVQKEKNRSRDFKQGKPIQFIIAGILLTIVWYLAIYLIVVVVLKFAS